MSASPNGEMMQHRRAKPSERTIATARLWLRPLVPEDAFDVAVLGGVAEVATMTGEMPYPLTIAAATAWIAELPEDHPSRCVMAIRHAGEMVGVCGYAHAAADCYSLGYFIGRPHWGRGFATEAATAIVRHCFQVTGADAMTALHFTGNRASARVLDKLGFTRIGTGHSWCPVHRTERSTLVYQLSAATFRVREIP